jgi:hypothetical protein
VEANVEGVPAEPEVESSAKQNDVANLYDNFEEGIEALRAAIDLFRKYAETREQELLEQAVKSVDAGGRLLAEAAGDAVQTAT